MESRVSMIVHTDGACKGNPGPGGWAAIIEYNGKRKELCGGCSQTTNNKMELTAVIKAIEWLNEHNCKPCDIFFLTDSTYVMMTKEKWTKWQKKKSIPNGDLWQVLLDTAKKGNHKLHFQHVYGHTGVELNERCDKLAREQATKFSHVAAGTNTLKIQEALAILNERSRG